MMRVILLLLLIPTMTFGEVGSVTQIEGNAASAKRNQEELVFEQVGFNVEMLDKLITAQTNLEITFEDESKVKITEQSELVIDEFVYDPNTNVGSVAMRVAIGTVQMTSGNIAHTNAERVSIKTPTANITVRGTDFSMTVDEFGRSLVILLPSCPDETLDEDECPVGAITVYNEAGSVFLNEAYQGTMVGSSAMIPSEPKKLLLDKANINNNLIIVPPAEFQNGFAYKEKEEEIKTALDVDLLEYEQLSVDFLQEDFLEFSELNINRIDNTYLDNFLDLMMELDLSKNDLDEGEDGPLPGISNYPWINFAVNEQYIYIESDRQPHIAVLTVSADTHGTYNLIQDEYKATIQIQDGGDNISIKVVQKQ